MNRIHPFLASLQLRIVYVVFSLFWVSALANAEPLPLQGDNISDQTLILVIHTNGEVVIVKDSFLKPLPFRVRRDDENLYHYNLLSNTNEVLYTGDFPDPLSRWVEDFSVPGKPTGGKETVSENEFVLKVPYFEDAIFFQSERIDAEGNTLSLGITPLPVSQ